jgi:hypothetical protein
LIKSDQQYGIPFINYRGTRAAIEALSNPQGGMLAFGWITDPAVDGLLGTYDEANSTWVWGVSGNLRYRGEWDNSTVYYVNDVVSMSDMYGTEFFLCISQNINSEPPDLCGNWLEWGGGGSSPSLTANRVVVTDSSGDLHVVDDLIYDPNTNSILMGGEVDGFLSALLGSGIRNILAKINEEFSLNDTYFMFGDTLTRGSGLQFFRAGGTKASPTAVVDGMVIGFLRGRGWHTAAESLSNAGSTVIEIEFMADGDWTSSSQPTKLNIYTCPSGSNAKNLVMTIGSDGSVTLPEYGSGAMTGTPAYGLAVNSAGKMIEVSGAIEPTGEKLAFLQLADSKADIYDPGTNYGQIKSILLYNSSLETETVELFLHDGTNEYRIYAVELERLETLLLEYPKGLPINASSKLTGNTTTADTVTCLISGIEGATELEEKVLAFVELSNSTADVYDSGSDIGHVHHIILHNTNTDGEVVSLNLNDGTDEFPITKATLSDDPAETVEFTFPESGFIVDASSKITGKSTTTNVVTCLVIGIER